ADPPWNAGAQVFEQGKRVSRIAADERPRPASQLSGRVWVLLVRQCAEVCPLVVGISEWVVDGGGGDIKDGPGGGVEFEFGNAVDYEVVGHGLKDGHRDGIAEDIMRPGHDRWGCRRHIARNQAKIAALPWAKHQ